MFRVVLFQFVTSVIVAAAAATLAGFPAALTALLGGLACTLPNGMFALHLWLLSRKRQYPGIGPTNSDAGSAAASSYAIAILLGEFCKVALSAFLLALLLLGYRSVVWPALLISVGAVLIVQPVALAWRRN
jgi:F0F1-type ATP synthase assembly protein I